MRDARKAATRFAGALAGFANSLHWIEGETDETEAFASLRPHLLSFHAVTGGPWPAVCSLWGQIYFNTLLIPATCLLASGWAAESSVRRLSASFCPESGAPLRFTLCGERREETAAEATLLHLLDKHVGIVIDELAVEGGLSKRMLWEGVDHTLRWTVAEIAADRPDSIPRLERLAHRFESRLRLAFPCSSKHRPATSARKFCCLRYQLAGHSACPEFCPQRKTTPL